MGEWTIYNLSGQSKAEVHNIEYEGNDGGARRVTVSVSSPIPIKWEVTDNISYRGEIFTLRHLPQEKKQARSGTHGEAFVYSDVVFYSAIDELASCEFLDVVKEDNNIHYSALPVFSFYCETIYDIADRLQANLDRVYTGAKKWTVEVSTDITAKIDIKPQALSFSKEKCSKVLERIVNELGVSYEYTNRTITFGAKPITMAYWFKYGKGEGLKSIGQSGADGNELVTRARVYGSTRNMPNRYYNKLYRNVGTTDVFYFKEPPEGVGVLWFPLISETMYVPNLMLPSFRESGKDAYLDATDAIAKYGVREGTKFFDSDNGEDEEIYPTIENMTADRLKELGYTPRLTDADNGNLDELLMVDDVPFSGVMPESGNLPSSEAHFVVYLKDIGFNLNGYLAGTPKISFRSGALAGREFDIVKCEKITLLGISYKLTCKRVEDTSIQLVFPYKDYKPSAGDKFVLLEIDMPEIYIKVAELRLKEEGEKWLELNSNPIYTYTPEINDVEMLRKPHIAEQLKEGRTLLFSDEDLGIEKAVRISSLRISEEDGSAPKYEVTLSDKVSASLADRVTQSVVESLGTNSVSVSNINSLVQAYGNEHYLSKTKRDTAKQVIRFSLGAEYGEYIKGNQGANIDSEGNAEVESVTSRTSVKGETIQGGWIGTPDFKQNSLMGTGGAIYQLNGATYAEFDYLTARKGATFAELIIQEYRSIGGALVISQANGEIESIYKWSNGNGYDIYLKEWNDNNQFVTNDLVRCQYWDRTTNQLTSYWVRVAITTDAEGVKCLNMLIADLNGAVPRVGDKLVQMGNTTDTSRQGCILLTTENSMPRMAILDGINSTILSNANYKAIYGSLDGFTDPYPDSNGNYKTLSGYGMWGENAYLHGEMVLSSTNTSVSDALTSVSNALTRTKALIDEEIAEINNRLDGVVVNWFGDDVPRLDNHPAEQWTTEQEKMNHIGDTYTNTETTGDNAGKSWRWVQENGEYKWILIADSDAIKALEWAAKAQSTADGKRRVFVNTPTTPYDEGDLWVKTENGVTTIYYCVTSKADGNVFDGNDWELASTDDSALQAFINGNFKEKISNLQTQIDGKAETWYQESDPSKSWITDDLKELHTGDMWYKTTTNTTYRWNGSSWDEQNIPKSVFDTIDGKAQIFVSTPTPPYYIGDLWVQGEDGDIMRCMTSRVDGMYNPNDWKKASKYTDDTELNAYKVEVGKEFQVTDGKFESMQYKIDGATSARNLLLKAYEPIENKNYLIGSYNLGNAKPKVGDDVTLSFIANVTDDRIKNFRVFNSGGVMPIQNKIQINEYGKDVKVVTTFTWNINANDGNTHINIYQTDADLKSVAGLIGNTKISKIKLEFGTVATDWSIAPEETDYYYESRIKQTAESIEFTVKNGLTETGIDIESKKITVTADNFSIQNNKGETTTSVDAQGNLAVSSVACRYNDGDEGTTPFVADWNAKGDGIQRWYYPNGNIRAEVGWDNNTESFIRKFDENGILLWKIGNPAEFMYDNEPIWVKIILSERYLGKGDIPKNNTSIAGVTYYKKTNVEGSTNNSVYKNNVGETLEYIDDGWYTDSGMPFMREITSSIQGVSPIIKYVRKAYHYESGKLIETSEVMWDV